MGVVWKAHDTSLGRDVAIKVLPDRVSNRPERLSRFQREARAVAALNHPNIVTIHSVEESDDVRFLTMELIEGEPLDRRVPSGGLPLPPFFDLAVPLVDALRAAHAQGIVHRDIKASNVMVTEDGRVKVLDFGLARFVREEDFDASGPTLTATQAGVVLGTPASMSPEQAEGRTVDARSDVFSTGALFYELLAGARPFDRGSSAGTLAAILHDEPDLASVRPDLPADLLALVDRCLDKDPSARFGDAADLLEELERCRRRHDSAAASSSRFARPAVLVPILIVLAGLVAAGLWWGRGAARERRVHRELVPRIESLLEEEKMIEAYAVAQEASRLLPDDPTVVRLVERTATRLDVVSEPSGARVSFQPYGQLDAEWRELGRTPIENAPVPVSYLRFRVDKQGYESRLLAAPPFLPTLHVDLVPEGQAPPGMVLVPDAEFAAGRAESLELPAYWIDRYEVTNRQYQEFVDAGGYRKPELWEPAALEAMERFVDATGRPGPATWELGSHPEDRGDYPVGGVSWYEAAAYARWAGKSLPTVYHWRHAAGITLFADILALSNFGGDGPAPIGSHQGLSPDGAYDMAGNLKEWCWNRVGDQRYILGGAWDEASYRFDENDARSPFEREPNFGFRCVRYETPPEEALTAPVSAVRYDFAQVEPVRDDIFEVFAGLYEYPRLDLDSRVEKVDDASRHWRRESVSFTPGYDGERMLLHLFVPKNASPPYQTVIFRAGGTTNWTSSVEEWISLIPAYIPRSGRLLAVPALYGTLERRMEGQGTISSNYRERFVRQVVDVRRSVDYLLTREDVDGERLAFVGLSAGAEYGAGYLAMERRFATAVLIAGGFHDEHMLGEPREINPWHYAPRVTTPVLMINGEHDFTVPVETAQKPMFRLLGTDPAHRKHVVVPGGHVTSDPTTVIREALAWLDRYLGPVAPEAR